MSARLSGAVTAGLTITDVLRPIMVAGADVEVVADGALELVVLLEAVLLLLVVPLPAVVRLVAVVLLFDLPPHAVTASAAAAATPSANSLRMPKVMKKDLLLIRCSQAGQQGWRARGVQRTSRRRRPRCCDTPVRIENRCEARADGPGPSS